MRGGGTKLSIVETTVSDDDHYINGTPARNHGIVRSTLVRAEVPPSICVGDNSCVEKYFRQAMN